MRAFIPIFVLLVLVGCDADRSVRLRTAQQITKIRAGEESHLISPLPVEFLAHSNDQEVVHNLTELSIIGDLDSYAGSSLADFQQIQKIDLYCTTNTDEFLSLLPLLPNLTELYIGETDATDDGIIAVSKCKGLIGFGLTSWGDQLSMESINQLSNITTLQQINLEISSRKQNLTKLRNSLPKCKIFETIYSNE